MNNLSKFGHKKVVIKASIVDFFIGVMVPGVLSFGYMFAAVMLNSHYPILPEYTVNMHSLFTYGFFVLSISGLFSALSRKYFTGFSRACMNGFAFMSMPISVYCYAVVVSGAGATGNYIVAAMLTVMGMFSFVFVVLKPKD